LDQHDDSENYSKEEPPSLSGRIIPLGRKLDFIVALDSTYAGLEVKNVREWFYPNRSEIRDLLAKCCALDVVPVFIARRVHFSTFSILNPCGVLIHQTYNQLYPNFAAALANQVKDKTLLGYHDVRVGNYPDARLTTFIGTNLPNLLSKARKQFNEFRDLLCDYGNQIISYDEFSEQVKIRTKQQP